MLATLETQKAIYEKLTEYGLNVYSTLPINAKLPYVQFTNIQLTENSNKSVKRQTYWVSLSVWCIDTTSINIHEMTKKVLNIIDEELNLGEEFAHDNTKLTSVIFSQDELNTETVNRAIVDFEITVSEN